MGKEILSGQEKDGRSHDRAPTRSVVTEALVPVDRSEPPQAFPPSGVIFDATLNPQTYKEPTQKTKAMLAVEKKTGRPIAELLNELYILQERSGREINEILKFNSRSSIVYQWLRKCTIPVRSQEEAVRLAFSDSAKKEVIARKTHSPLLNKIRSAKNKRYYRENPEQRLSLAAKIRRAHKRRSAKKMKEALGNRPKATLQRMVKKEGLTNVEIARQLKEKKEIVVSKSTVGKWRREMGIVEKGQTTRVKEENKALVNKARADGRFSQLSQKYQNILNDRYPRQGKPIGQADLAGKYDLTTRQGVQAREKAALQALRDTKEKKNMMLENIIDVFGENPEQRLRELYIDQGITTGKIADKINRSASTVQRWLKYFNIPRRNRLGRPRKRS